MSVPASASKPVYPPTFLLISVVLMIALHVLLPGKQVIRATSRYAGLIPMAAGFAVVLWAARIFETWGTTIKPFEESSALVIQGPYRVSRNPIYLGMVIGLIGVAMLLGSVTPFLVIPAFAYLIDRRFVRVEEAQLEQTFGSEYASYRARVRRWL